MQQSHEPPSTGPEPSPGATSNSETEGAGAIERSDVHFRGGTIELRSGRWKWTAHIGEKGSAVVFHDEKSPNNRMRAWLPGAIATEEEVRRAGQEPEIRWWEDAVGTVWEAQVEESSFHPPLEQRTRPRRRITFEQLGHRVGTELPEGRTLGELTVAELTALLYESD